MPTETGIDFEAAANRSSLPPATPMATTGSAGLLPRFIENVPTS